MYNILVCDDDKEIVEAISIYLVTEGYNIFKAYDGIEALDIMGANDIHLLIMDIMMPRMDGLRATLKLREKSNIPVILLSAKSEDSDKIIGLNVGADDYITKPFNPLELVARVKSQLRRYTQLGNMTPEDDGILVNGGLVIDDNQKSVTVDGEVVKLTPIEYSIIRFLTQNLGKVYSTTELYEAVWNENPIGSENIIAVHIRHIREKIEIDPKDPRYLKVVWGQGYKMEKL